MKDEWCVSPTDFYWIARCLMNCYRLPLRQNEGTRPLQMRAASTAGPTLPSPLLAIIIRHSPFRKSCPRLQCCALLCLVSQSCLTLCDPMDCSLPGSSVHGDSPGKNTGVGCHALLQGIFPTQGSNPGLPNCRWILYRLSHHGSPGYWGKQTLGAPGPVTFPASPYWAEASQRDGPQTFPLLSIFGLFSYPLQSLSFFHIILKLSHRTHFFPLNLHSANHLACPGHPEKPENWN